MKGLNDDEICDFVRLTEHKVCVADDSLVPRPHQGGVAWGRG